MTTRKSHLNTFYSLYKHYPAVLTADAGFGSEANYVLLVNKKIAGYVNTTNLIETNVVRIKTGLKVTIWNTITPGILSIVRLGTDENIGTATRKTANGFKQTLTYYQAGKCKGCPVRDACHSQKGNRIVGINHRLRKLKDQANARLIDDEGLKHRKKRPTDIEPVFASIKHNKDRDRIGGNST